MKLISQHTVISILVMDQEEALRFYTEKLGLEKRSDITFGPGLRWLTVGAERQRKPEIALARPDAAWHGEERVQELMGHIGQGAPWLFVTENCHEEYEQLRARGVTFLRAPTRQFYGVEAVFVDPYGNAFSLLEASPEVRAMFESKRIGTAA